MESTETPETSTGSPAPTETAAPTPPAAPTTAAPAGTTAPATAAPLAFSLSFSFFALGAILVLTVGRVLDDWEEMARWTLLTLAIPVAAHALLLAGSLEMLRTTIGPARRGAALAVIAAAALLASAATANFFHAYSTSRVGRDVPMGPWHLATWVSITGWHVLSAAVLLCGWSVPRARQLAAAALACSLVAHRYAFYGGGASSLLSNAVVHHLVWAAQLCLLWLALRASVPEPEPFGGWLRTGRAVARLGNAMSLRLSFAVAAAALSFFFSPIVASSTLGEAELAMLRFGAPAGLALSTLLAVSGSLSAAGLAVFNAPRRHFATAAALFTVILFIRATQTLVAYLIFPRQTSATVALPVILPLLETAAFALVVLGCRRLAEQLEASEALEKANHALLLVKAAQSVAILAPLFFVAAGEAAGVAGAAGNLAGGVFALSTAGLLGYAAPLVSALAISRLCAALAKEITVRGELPAAVVQR